MSLAISSFPKEFSKNLQLGISADTQEHCIIMLSDDDGKIKRMLGVDLEPGNNAITVEGLFLLVPGPYLLTVRNSDAQAIFQEKITKI